jgi:hypothetical protein
MSEDNAVDFDSDIQETVVEGVAREMEQESTNLIPERPTVVAHVVLEGGDVVTFATENFNDKAILVSDGGRIVLDISFDEVPS